MTTGFGRMLRKEDQRFVRGQGTYVDDVHLRGKPATEPNFEQAAKIAAEHCHPVPDQRGPEDYKRHLVAELTARALRRAAERAAAGRAAA